MGSVHTFDFVCEANVSAEKTSIFNPSDLGTISPFRGHSLRELSPLKKKPSRLLRGRSPLHRYLTGIRKHLS